MQAACDVRNLSEELAVLHIDQPQERRLKLLKSHTLYGSLDRTVQAATERFLLCTPSEVQELMHHVAGKNPLGVRAKSLSQELQTILVSTPMSQIEAAVQRVLPPPPEPLKPIPALLIASFAGPAFSKEHAAHLPFSWSLQAHVLEKQNGELVRDGDWQHYFNTYIDYLNSCSPREYCRIVRLLLKEIKQKTAHGALCRHFIDPHFGKKAFLSRVQEVVKALLAEPSPPPIDIKETYYFLAELFVAYSQDHSRFENENPQFKAALLAQFQFVVERAASDERLMIYTDVIRLCQSGEPMHSQMVELAQFLEPFIDKHLLVGLQPWIASTMKYRELSPTQRAEVDAFLLLPYDEVIRQTEAAWETDSPELIRNTLFYIFAQHCRKPSETTDAERRILRLAFYDLIHLLPFAAFVRAALLLRDESAHFARSVPNYSNTLSSCFRQMTVVRLKTHINSRHAIGSDDIAALWHTAVEKLLHYSEPSRVRKKAHVPELINDCFLLLAQKFPKMVKELRCIEAIKKHAQTGAKPEIRENFEALHKVLTETLSIL